ncbi:hypothetical protein IWQ61_006008 [Dispira simplex]|nr:hypothetical protein IWQ61_006008 [Dispira simplex]
MIKDIQKSERLKLLSSLEVVQSHPLDISFDQERPSTADTVIKRIARRLLPRKFHKQGQNTEAINSQTLALQRALERLNKDLERLFYPETARGGPPSLTGPERDDLYNAVFWNKDPFIVLTNMLESAEAAKIYERWKNLGVSSDTVSVKLEELKKSASDCVKLIKEQGLAKTQDVENNGEDYSKKRNYLLAKFSAESERGSLLSGLILAAITTIQHNWDPSVMDRWDEPLERVYRALKDLDGNYKAGPIIGVTFDPNDPVRSFLMFPVFSICKAVSPEEFGNIFEKVVLKVKSERQEVVIGKEFIFLLGATTLYTVTLEIAIREGSETAKVAFLKMREGFRNAWEHPPTGCADKPYTTDFLETNLLKKLDEKSKEPFPLAICRVVYAWYQFDSKTRKYKCQLPMTTTDHANREAWAQRLVEFREQQSQESRLIIP